MKIYVLRHGETTSNASELIVGRSDVPLTENGEQQAREAAGRFTGRDPSTTLGVTNGVTGNVILSERSESNNLLPEVIFASPLIRAQKTAQIVNEELLSAGMISKPLHVITEPRLIEQDYGKLEGQSRFLEEFAESKKQFADFTHVAESQLRLAARVYTFLDELKNTDYNSALLVTHGGICRIIHTYFNSMTIEEFAEWRAVNCEINKYDL